MEASRRRTYAPRLAPEQRREQLLDAALELILGQGYGGMSMEAVARRAGVTKPVVYDLYADRGALQRELLAREERRAFEDLRRAMPSGPVTRGPDEQLVESVRLFLEAVARNRSSWRLILLPVEGTPEVVRRHVERNRDVVLGQVEALADWGLRERGGPADLEPHLTAHAIIALAEQGARLVLTDPARYPPERLARFVAALVAEMARGEAEAAAVSDP